MQNLSLWIVAEESMGWALEFLVSSCCVPFDIPKYMNKLRSDSSPDRQCNVTSKKYPLILEIPLLNSE